MTEIEKKDAEIAELQVVIVNQQNEIIKLTNELVNINDTGGASQTARKLKVRDIEIKELREYLKGWREAYERIEKQRDEKQRTIRALKKEVAKLTADLIAEKDKSWFTRLFG